MPEWLVVVLAIIAVPVVLAIGGLSIAGMAIWVSHRSKMRKLEIEEKERQAEMDRELLGLGSDGLGAQLEAMLERMNNLEARMGRLEQGSGGRAIPISGVNSAKPTRGTATETQQG